MMRKTFLLALLAVASTDASSSNLRNRELWGSSSSSSSSSGGWSFWGSLLQLLDHMHMPCPPGHLHHKDEDGKPLPPGECWQDLHHPPHHHHHHSGGSSHSSGGGGGGGSSSSSSSSYSSFTFIECNEGDAGCYQNLMCEDICANDNANCDCQEYIMCSDDDVDCINWITCDDDSADCMVNVHGAGWADDGHDDGAVEVASDDAAWDDDGWTAQNAAYAKQSYESENSSTPAWPFFMAMLVACAVGVAFVVQKRRQRRSDESESVDVPASKSNKKRMFGFNRKKSGANEDFDNEDSNYVEMSP